MKYILGKKISMTQVWSNGEAVAVTKVKTGPCVVVQVRNDKQDGYRALQVGFGVKSAKNINKPQKNHFKELGNFRYLKEFRLKDGDETQAKRGDVIDINSFAPGDMIKVTGTSKGKGFQGVVKRYGFHGQDKTHGNKDQLRMPGSIGSTGPAHVFKGTKMGGRTGGDQVTVANLKIMEVDQANNELIIMGAVPGARNGLLMISGIGELKFMTEAELKEKEVISKDTVAEPEVASEEAAVETEKAEVPEIKETPVEKTETIETNETAETIEKEANQEEEKKAE